MRTNKLDNLRINIGKWDVEKAKRYDISTFRKKSQSYIAVQERAEKKCPIYIEVVYPNGFNNEAICKTKAEAKNTLASFIEQDLINYMN